MSRFRFGHGDDGHGYVYAPSGLPVLLCTSVSRCRFVRRIVRYLNGRRPLDGIVSEGSVVVLDGIRVAHSRVRGE